ncbi:uncharacterized protein SPPG_07915 [Spizellomyces punctatus DAOM BR117]|uniref:Cytochrome b5 heme-binding domain-containing protein n=1 Tax=Spizellomyces punctatus (strain DAOM BR117) TaxID=645134 RepID=A0A0L0H6W4_SPIPD|nr:uncharacterized protein SPPG_07915 [Spizellomyces punctatus DAOM BR117]KNC96704.1 hypothetical protein SPPG_07915 [Spizellomyces punctatus DAOM BR117]|eukprot:XP_016604744.1 hypothetical protein SPPG_07915 [Spizellomyces punctatus DAOM BR117]
MRIFHLFPLLLLVEWTKATRISRDLIDNGDDNNLGILNRVRILLGDDDKHDDDDDDKTSSSSALPTVGPTNTPVTFTTKQRQAITLDENVSPVVTVSSTSTGTTPLKTTPTPTSVKTDKAGRPSPTPSPPTSSRIVPAGKPAINLQLPVGSLEFAYGIDDFEPTNSFHFYWTVETDSIHGALTFNATKYWMASKKGEKGKSIWNAWIGFGFGPSMLTSDMLILYANPNTKRILFTESDPSKKYSPPVPSAHKILVTDGLLQTVVDNTIVFEFRRPIRPSDNNHWNIDIDEEFSVIWAFNADPDERGKDGYLFYHGERNRGRHLINFLNGANRIVNDGMRSKEAHGIGMFVSWCILMPFGLFWSRYMKSRPGWMRIHIATQTLATLLTIIFCSIIIAALRPEDPRNTPRSENHDLRSHPLLGLILFPLIMTQAFLGTYNRLGLSVEWIKRHKWFRILHSWIGKALVFTGFVQSGLGIDIMYPLEETYFRGKGQWIFFAIVCVFWMGLFVGSEAVGWWNRRRTLQVSGKKVNAWYTPGKQTTPPAVKEELSKTSQDLALNHSTPSKPLQKYTWGDIDSAILAGELLVVANGQYVYDISRWVSSHPGGQLIMYTVAGTDITNDYFGEAGVDPDEFLRRENVSDGIDRASVLPEINGKSNLNNSLPRVRTLPRRKTLMEASSPRSSSAAPPTYGSTSFTEQEWRLIQKSRRTHSHTNAALARLSTLLVGEITGSSATWIPAQYHRYALVSSTLLTPPSHSSPIYKLKFTILYPHTATNPPHFVPGQAIQLSTRINNTIHTRFYTPINGSMGSFEIIVKHTGGPVSSFLTRSKEGERQWKFRGPCGVGTFSTHPSRPLSSTQSIPEKILYISAGSALVQALQFLSTLFLPAQVPLQVFQSYSPQNPDELALSPSDQVLVHSHSYDGWAEGRNITTNESGVFPLGVTYPPCGALPVVTLLSCVHSVDDCIGRELIEGACLAYPGQLRVMWVLSTPAPKASFSDSCIVHEGRLDQAVLDQALNVAGWNRTMSDASQKILVCGPKPFEGFVYESLVDGLGVSHAEVCVLPDEPKVAESS